MPNYNVQLVTPAAAEPLSVAEFLAHSRIDSPDYADIAGKLRAARVDIEGELEIALLTSTWDLFLTEWPADGSIRLPKGVIQSVISVKYTNSDALEATFAALSYHVDTSRFGFGRVLLAYGESWPSVALRTWNPIAVRFVAGWKRWAGTVNTAGTAVTWQTGDKFDVTWSAETPILINGTPYLVASVTTDQTLTLTTSPGVLTGVGYSANAVPWDIKAAINLRAAAHYEHREEVTLGNTAIESKRLVGGSYDLLRKYSVPSFGA